MRTLYALVAKSLLIFSLMLLFAQSVSAGKIIRPWRATSAIVEQGGTFEVWFDADSGQTIQSVDLRSKYKTVTNLPKSEESGSWEYDILSHNRYNKILTVTVPASTPADRYELILRTSTGQETSTGAVKVVQEFKNEYYIAATSCSHRYQSYDGNRDGSRNNDDHILLLRKISEVLKACEIMDVEMMFEGGDNLYSINNAGAYYNGSNGRPNRSRTHEYFLGIEELDIWGMHDSSAATYMVPGNHDSLDNTVNSETAEELGEFWNQYWGMHYHVHAYGNARYLNINNGWGGGSKDPSGQTRKLRDQLDSGMGRGNFIVSTMHMKQESSSGPYNEIAMDLSMVGHQHTTANQNPLSIPHNGGWSAPIQYVSNSNKDSSKFEFNLFKINNNGSYTTPSGSTARVQVIQGDVQSQMDDNPSNWTKMLELNYGSNNNGSQLSNSGTIINRHNFQIDDAKIRFVMPLGSDYTVDRGSIRQAFNGDNYHVVDVAVDVPANSNVTVNILPGGDPIVRFINPPGDITIGDGNDLNLEVSATDSDGVTSVEMFINGAPMRTEGGAPYTWSVGQGDLQLQNLQIGEYTFLARATDTNLDQGEDSITVTVVDSDTQITFVKPAEGTLIYEGGSLEVEVDAVDIDGVDRVWLYLNDVELVRSEGIAPYTWGVAQGDTELQNLAADDYQLKAVVRDTLGNLTESVIPITVHDINTIPPVRVNFQPSAATVPSGYIADTSQPYGDRGNGYHYGWESAFNQTRERNADADQRLDTLNHTQANGGDHYWEIEVLNGQYEVNITGGDPTATDSFINFVAEEGTANEVTLMSASAAGVNFVSGSQVVLVSDGRLTISNGASAVNNKICYVEIIRYVPNNPPVITSAPVTDAVEGELYTYAVIAADADGDALTYSAPLKPDWLTLSAAGVLSGTPQASDVKTHSIRIQVSDGPDSDVQEFAIVVEASTPASKVASIISDDGGTNGDPSKNGLDDDYDGDGQSNLMEFALGGNLVSRAVKANKPSAVENSGQLDFSFRRNRDDLYYYVEVSDDLISWTVNGTLPDKRAAADELVSVSIVGSRTFVRLRVSDASD